MMVAMMIMMMTGLVKIRAGTAISFVMNINEITLTRVQ
jgi:hypothetical protein